MNRRLKQMARLIHGGEHKVQRGKRLNCEEETSAQSHGTCQDQLTETSSFSMLEPAMACCI